MVNDFPLKDFLYCPHCGSPRFVKHDAYSKHCLSCGFTFYPNAAAATVAIILNGRGQLLCIERKKEPAKGTLDLPGGFVDPGESITEGLFREVKEEINAEVISYRFLFSEANDYNYSNHIVHTADAFFLCTIKDETAISAADDAAKWMWLNLSEIRPSQFGLHSVRRGVERLLQMRTTSLQ